MFQNRVLRIWLWYIHVMNDHPSIKIHVEKYWQGKVLTSYAKQDVHVTFIIETFSTLLTTAKCQAHRELPMGTPSVFLPPNKTCSPSLLARANPSTSPQTSSPIPRPEGLVSTNHPLQHSLNWPHQHSNGSPLSHVKSPWMTTPNAPQSVTQVTPQAVICFSLLPLLQTVLTKSNGLLEETKFVNCGLRLRVKII